MIRRSRLICVAVAAFLAATAPAFAGPSVNLDLMTHLYGIDNSPAIAESDFTVGTTATRIEPADAARIEDVIVNTGTSNCAVRHSPGVTMTQGIVLVTGGGSLSESFWQDATIMTGETWAICAASGGTLHLLTIDLQ